LLAMKASTLASRISALSITRRTLNWRHLLPRRTGFLPTPCEQLRIRRSIHRFAGIGLPKTASSEREVDMLALVVDELQEQRARTQMRGEFVFLPRKPLIFTNSWFCWRIGGAGDRGRTGDVQLGKGADSGGPGKPEDENPWVTRIFRFSPSSDPDFDPFPGNFDRNLPEERLLFWC
jgi:hypothetical protein